MASTSPARGLFQSRQLKEGIGIRSQLFVVLYDVGGSSLPDLLGACSFCTKFSIPVRGIVVFLVSKKTECKHALRFARDSLFSRSESP